MTAATRDYYEPVDALDDHAMPYDPAEVTVVLGERVVPFRCHDCARPAYYDRADERYHHAVDAAVGCFLIPAEDLADDEAHPDLRRRLYSLIDADGLVRFHWRCAEFEAIGFASRYAVPGDRLTGPTGRLVATGDDLYARCFA